MRSLSLWLGLACLLLTQTGCTSRNDKALKLAFVSNNAFDFWNIADKGTQKAQKELADQGIDVQVEFRKPTRGAEEQKQIIEALLARGVKGIAVSPNDAKNMEPFYRDKVNPAVPLIMQDSDLPDPKSRRCYIGTHNYRAGRAVGELIAKAVPDGGKIAIFVGKLDVQNARERRQGVIDYLKDPAGKQEEMGEMTPPDAADLKLGKYTLVATKTDDTKEELCLTQARQLISQHPDIACLVGLWAYNPPNLLRAVKGLEKKPIVVGFDEDYATLDGIKAGDCYGTVVQNPFEFGRQSILILAGLARGDEGALKNRADVDDQGRIFIPHRVITKENVDPFYDALKKLKGS